MKTIQKRLEFLILLAIFTPVILDALYAKDITTGKIVIMQWGLVIAILVFCYFLLEFKIVFIQRAEWVINFILGFNIILFIIFFIILALNQGDDVSLMVSLTFLVVINSLMWLPVILGIIFVFHISLVREIPKNLMRINKILKSRKAGK